MQIRVVNYMPSISPLVQAFVDIELDGWLRFNGVNYLRDGSLKSAQLRYDRNGQRNWLSAVVVIDRDLRALLAADILAAIHVHVASLPLEKRMRPPRPPAVPPEKPPTNKRALPPPTRLLAGAKGARP